MSKVKGISSIEGSGMSASKSKPALATSGLHIETWKDIPLKSQSPQNLRSGFQTLNP